MMRRALLIAVLLLVSVPAGAAEFMPPYLEGAQVESIRIRIETFEKLIAAQKKRIADLVAKKKREEEQQIETTYQKVVNSLQDKERKRRDALIKRMEIFLQRHPSSPLIADSMLRLGELYFERANDEFLVRMAAYEKALEKFSTGEIKEEPELPVIDYASSIDLYQKFVDKFPAHPKIEEALYLLGYTLQEDMRGDEAVDSFTRLLRDRPKTAFAPEVHFRLGEFYFEIGEFQQAIAEYQATMSYNEAVLYDKALYKLGWTYYRMDRTADAVAEFIKVIDYSESHTEAESAMRREAVKYIGISYSDAGGLEALEKHIKDIGGRAYAIVLYLGFADVLYDQTRFVEAIEAYVRTTERFPLYRDNPAILVKVMETQQRMGELDKAFAVRERIVHEYGPDSAWYQYYAGTATSPAHDAKLAAKTRETAETLQYEFAKYWHAKAQNLASDMPEPATGAALADLDLTKKAAEGGKGKAKSKAKEKAKKDKKADAPKPGAEPLEPNLVRAARYYDRAADSYALFLRLFPESKRGAEAGFLLAELLYAKRQWPEAGARYRNVTRDLVNPNNRYFGDAAWNMVLSYRNWLDEYEKSFDGQKVVKYYQFLIERGGEPVTDATLAAQLGQPPAFPQQATKLIEAVRYYQDLFPQSDRNALLTYTNGQIYLRYGENAKARAEFLAFIERYPGHDLSFEALKSVVTSFSLERKFGDLNKYAYEVLDSPLGRKKEIADYLGGILSGSVFKDAQVEEQKGNRLRAAALYQLMVRKFPKSDFADDALFNAGLNLEREGKYYDAISVFERLLKEYPKTDFAAKAVFLIAKNNERVLNYLGAIKYYLKLAREFPKEKEGPDAVYNSALLLEKLGDLKRAAEVYLEYVNKYPERTDLAEVVFFAADAYYKARDWNKAAAVYENYVRGPYEPKTLVVEATYKWAQCEEKLGRLDRSKTLIIQTSLLYKAEKAKGKINPPEFGAHGAFLQALEEFEIYKGIKLQLPPQKMAKLLEAKAIELKRIIGVFTDVVAIGDAKWASAALYMIGESYQNFADTLFDAPVPKELSEEEAEIYKLELQDKAFPIEDKAIQAFQKQIDTSLKAGIENEWTEKTRLRLRKLNPNLERAKGNETPVLGRNEFFYRFGQTTEHSAEYEIRDGKVVYANAAEGASEGPEKVKLSRAQERILSGGTRPSLLLSADGTALEPAKEAPRAK
jgi:TolA-binding protein